MNDRAEALIEMYASKVFNDGAMRKYLPGETYKQLAHTINRGKPLEPELADIVANGLKRWALDQGATHYTHWFQPMTGMTAEKHDSFINPQPDGTVLMSFSGKELIKGEGDASSFPSGGIRTTFEARGYTAWDCTSPAFVKDKTLYIPTCFCSFTGETLDKKTPLLRSMEALSKHGVRVAKALGLEAERIISVAGAEQEYFLVDKELYSKRLDLMLCGRTLFGARTPKGQELDDHYYGNIKERVMDFMRQADNELWELGVPAKTEHNEAAPGQHELAAVYTTVNIACDQNQLIMETLKKVALRNGLVCLLHEKPFARLNGSGKHNNWSINIDGGKSLFSQGKTPETNARFLLMLAAVLWAVDEYSELLRLSISGPGNEHRLGGYEAPPPIVSVFLGDFLTGLLNEIAEGKTSAIKQGGKLAMGVTTMPDLSLDLSDRNRTSPFAFTGQKFEFRMLGSSMSIADCNIVINTMTAEIFSRMADRLEQADDAVAESQRIISEVMAEHSRIIFNGNNYSEEWRKEAEQRGLPIIESCVEAADHLISEKSIDLFTRHGIFTTKELESRYEIRLESYIKTINIEASTMVQMSRRQIAPAVAKYSQFIADTINSIKQAGIAAEGSMEFDTLKDIAQASVAFKYALQKLERAIDAGAVIKNKRRQAEHNRLITAPAMEDLREWADKLEQLIGEEYWPMPTYSDLLFDTV